MDSRIQSKFNQLIRKKNAPRTNGTSPPAPSKKHPRALSNAAQQPRKAHKHITRKQGRPLPYRRPEPSSTAAVWYCGVVPYTCSNQSTFAATLPLTRHCGPTSDRNE